jgi:hypothetical protein
MEKPQQAGRQLNQAAAVTHAGTTVCVELANPVSYQNE